MSLEFNVLFPGLDAFDPSSKVWVYFSDRKFSNEESKEIESKVDQFCIQWASHGSKVSSKGFLVLNRIIVLVADESKTGVSGCSTDSSVRFIKSLELEFLTSLMKREFIYYLNEEGQVEKCPIDQIRELDTNTIEVFNPFFKDLKEMREIWLMPLAQSKYKSLV